MCPARPLFLSLALFMIFPKAAPGYDSVPPICGMVFGLSFILDRCSEVTFTQREMNHAKQSCMRPGMLEQPRTIL